MERIVLFMQHKENSRILSELLSKKYEVVTADSVDALDEQFDLCILDGLALSRFWKDIQARRKKQDEVS